jgi:tRNA-splicing endonuclease subunit Sen54
MHNALAFQRIHQPKHHTIAIYHPESNMAYAYNPKGPLFTKMGQTLPLNEDPLGNERRGHRLWLLPEEALYLLEVYKAAMLSLLGTNQLTATHLHMSATLSSLL